MAAPQISVTPSTCVMDEPVVVQMSGLEPSSVYTLYTKAVDCNDVPFFTVATYKSDGEGKVDLTKTPAVGGHFKGLLPMAPFSHLLPVEARAMFPRFNYSDTTRPVKFELSVYPGPVAIQLVTIGAAACGMSPVCSTVHTRVLIADGVRRIPIRDGKVRATLYLPKGDGPFPGVVDLFGAAGGLMEHRAALFAARGFAALALAYFAYEDLQESMDTGFDIAYFDEAVQYLLSRPEVRKVGVGVIGSSKGGDLVLSMATNIPQVRATIVVNGCICTVGAGTRLKDGSELPSMPFDPSGMTLLRDGVMEMFNMSVDPRDHPDCIIPVEKAYGDILWLAGGGDRGMNSSLFAQVGKERCEKAGVPNKIRVLTYPKTGHLFEPAYIPFCEVALQEVMKIGTMWGGSANEHSQAQVDSWREVQAFLNEKLK